MNDRMATADAVTTSRRSWRPRAVPHWVLRALPVGVANTLVDAAALNLFALLGFTGAAAERAVANAIAFTLGCLNSYVWNDRYVFRTRAGVDRSRLARFGLVNVAALIINTVAVVILSRAAETRLSDGAALNLAKALATMLTLGWSLALYRTVVFSPSSGTPTGSEASWARVRRLRAVVSAPAGAIAGITVVAFLVRVPFLPHESWDYLHYLTPWYDAFQHDGYVKATASGVSNYTPPYVYLLGGLTELPAPRLAAIKGLSLVFDLVLATGVLLLVRERYRQSWTPAILAYGATLCAPTVVLNGAAWAQCDASYAAFLVLSVLFVARGRPWWAMFFFGVAFAFKVQAVFLVPALLVFTLRGRVPVLSWLVVPAVYIAAVLPAWILGRPLWDLLMIYRDQADQYGQLTLNAPNIYQWLPDLHAFRRAGVAWTALATVAFCAVHLRNRREPLSMHEVVTLATASVLLVPFLLPHMHERYFYAADVFAIVYAFLSPRRACIPVLVITASFICYWPFLFGGEPVPLPLATAVMGIATVVVVGDAGRIAWKPPALARPVRHGTKTGVRVPHEVEAPGESAA